MASGREGDKARSLPRMDRAPGTGPTPFTDPRSLISWAHDEVGGAWTPPRGSGVTVGRGTLRPPPTPSQVCPRMCEPLRPSPAVGSPAASVSPLRGQGWELPLVLQLHLSPSCRPSSPHQAGLRIPSPPAPAANGVPRHQPQKTLCCPARPSEQCPPVCPGKRLCGGRGAVGTRGTEDSPGVGGRVGAGRAGRGGCPGTPGPGALAHGSLASLLRCPLSHTDASWAVAVWAAWSPGRQGQLWQGPVTQAQDRPSG